MLKSISYKVAFIRQFSAAAGFSLRSHRLESLCHGSIAIRYLKPGKTGKNRREAWGYELSPGWQVRFREEGRPAVVCLRNRRIFSSLGETRISRSSLPPGQGWLDFLCYPPGPPKIAGRQKLLPCLQEVARARDILPPLGISSPTTTTYNSWPRWSVKVAPDHLIRRG